MEDENPPAVPAELSELQEQCVWLRKQVLTILVLVIVISGTLNVFLLRQWRYVNTDLKTLREQTAPMIADYQKVSGPRINEFINRIRDYGRTHPDFQAIMTKYQLSATSAPPPAATPPK